MKGNLSVSDNDLSFTGLSYTSILGLQSSLKIPIIWPKLLHWPGSFCHISSGYVAPQGFIFISAQTFTGAYILGPKEET